MTDDVDQFEDFDSYCDALRKRDSLTPKEYACLLEQHLAYGDEAYSEIYTQYRSECAMFGDAGPGQGLRVSELGRELRDTRAKLATVRRIIQNLSA